MPEIGRLSDRSKCAADTHLCPACPHQVEGPAVQGSLNVFVNSRMVVRVGDQGLHGACCGPNTWKAIKGSASVFVNGKPVHRKGDTVQHCGGVGVLIEGSDSVFAGG